MSCKHLAYCSVCGDVGCEDCIWDCEDCGELYCADCFGLASTSICQYCPPETYADLEGEPK